LTGWRVQEREMAMVQFIMRADNPEVPPPYDFPNMTIMSFRLPATVANLQNLCDQWLNIGSPQRRLFEYRAVAGFVDMDIVTYPKMLFDQAPYNSWGFATQQEFYFRFMVWKHESISGVLFPVAIPEWTFPFIFVDNSWSMISGRNVIGFPKVMAQFHPTPVHNPNPFNIEISALALKTHSAATQLDWQPIVAIKPDKGTSPLPVGNWPWLEIGSLAYPTLQPYLQAFLATIPTAFSTIGLQQFRDASSQTDACYQAVVATHFAPYQIGTPTALPAATVTVNQYASLDIPGSLGFPAGTPLQPMLQYAVTVSMKASGATNLFVNS
jgi:Acetoacetate decarboxylase (ADC)